MAAIERNSYDYAKAYAETQSSVPEVINDLVSSYNLIAQNLGISMYQFIQQLQNQTNPGAYLAAQLNNVRPRNTLYGVIGGKTTPKYIAREIAP